MPIWSPICARRACTWIDSANFRRRGSSGEASSSSWFSGTVTGDVPVDAADAMMWPNFLRSASVNRILSSVCLLRVKERLRGSGRPRRSAGPSSCALCLSTRRAALVTSGEGEFPPDTFFEYRDCLGERVATRIETDVETNRRRGRLRGRKKIGLSSSNGPSTTSSTRRTIGRASSSQRDLSFVPRDLFFGSRPPMPRLKSPRLVWSDFANASQKVSGPKRSRKQAHQVTTSPQTLPPRRSVRLRVAGGRAEPIVPEIFFTGRKGDALLEQQALRTCAGDDGASRHETPLCSIGGDLLSTTFWVCRSPAGRSFL